MQKELNEVEKACMGTIDREVKEKIKEIEDKQHDRNRKIVKEIIEALSKNKSWGPDGVNVEMLQ